MIYLLYFVISHRPAHQVQALKAAPDFGSIMENFAQIKDQLQIQDIVTICINDGSSPENSKEK